VDGRDGPHGGAADSDLLCGRQLDRCPAEAQRARGAAGGDDGRLGFEPPGGGVVVRAPRPVAGWRGAAPNRSRAPGLLLKAPFRGQGDARRHPERWTEPHIRAVREVDVEGAAAWPTRPARVEEFVSAHNVGRAGRSRDLSTLNGQRARLGGFDVYCSYGTRPPSTVPTTEGVS
jgi:hypothetical protein